MFNRTTKNPRAAVAAAERKLARTTGAHPDFERWSARRRQKIADATAALNAAVLAQGLAEHAEAQDIARTKLGNIALKRPLMALVARVLEDEAADWNELGKADYASWMRAPLHDIELVYGIEVTP